MHFIILLLSQVLKNILNLNLDLIPSNLSDQLAHSPHPLPLPDVDNSVPEVISYS